MPKVDSKAILNLAYNHSFKRCQSHTSILCYIVYNLSSKIDLIRNFRRLSEQISARVLFKMSRAGKRSSNLDRGNRIITRHIAS